MNPQAIQSTQKLQETFDKIMGNPIKPPVSPFIVQDDEVHSILKPLSTTKATNKYAMGSESTGEFFTHPTKHSIPGPLKMLFVLALVMSILYAFVKLELLPPLRPELFMKLFEDLIKSK